MSEPPRLRLAVVGTGLMGTSIVLAAERAGFENVAGFDPDERSLAGAVERGAIDIPCPSISDAVRRRSRSWPCLFVRLPGRLRRPRFSARELHGTDVGSTKASVCVQRVARRGLSAAIPCAGPGERPLPERRAVRRRDVVPDALRRGPRELPASSRIRHGLRRHPGARSTRRARPARGTNEPSAARASEPRRIQAGARAGQVRCGDRVAARHDTRRRRQPASLGRHLPGQPGRATGRAGRPPAGGGAPGSALEAATGAAQAVDHRCGRRTVVCCGRVRRRPAATSIASGRTCQTRPACSPPSPRRSVPTASTSRTSSFTISRPTAAACPRSSSPARRRRLTPRHCSKSWATASSSPRLPLPGRLARPPSSGSPAAIHSSLPPG